MLACVLSVALSAILSTIAPPGATAEAPGSATAEVNGIEAFPVEVEVNSGWGDTVVVIIMSISPIQDGFLRLRKAHPLPRQTWAEAR